MDVESEIRELKRRVGELEGSHGFVGGQVRDVHRALLGFQEETGGRLDRLESKVEEMDHKIDELPRALAEIIAPSSIAGTQGLSC